MIDNITLSVPQSQYELDLTKFNHPEFINPYNTQARILFLRQHHGYRKYTNNMPSSYRSELGEVYPNLAIHETLGHHNGNYQRNLHISCSLPHLLNGQSFDEITDHDFDNVITVLVRRLKIMGAIIEPENIANAIVKTLHYCINIPFTSNAEVRNAITRLSKLNVDSRMENNLRIYANDGMSCRFRANVFEAVFYSKYYDILQPKCQKFSQRVTAQERAMSQKMITDNNVPPVLRFEIRFNGIPSISRRLRTLGGVDQKTWTFRQVFSSKLSRQVLSGYWQKLLTTPGNSEYLATTLATETIYLLFEEFHSHKAVFEGYGLYHMLILLGPKNLKHGIIEHGSRSQWNRKIKLISDFASRHTANNSQLTAIINNALNQQLSLIV